MIERVKNLSNHRDKNFLSHISEFLIHWNLNTFNSFISILSDYKIKSIFLFFSILLFDDSFGR